MGREIQKIPDWQQNEKDILLMIKDIISFLKNNEKPRILLNLIRMEVPFQSFIVKEQIQHNIIEKYGKYNKVIMRNCVKLYFQYWSDCNKAYHKPQNIEAEIKKYYSKTKK